MKKVAPKKKKAATPRKSKKVWPKRDRLALSKVTEADLQRVRSVVLFVLRNNLVAFRQARQARK